MIPLKTCKPNQRTARLWIFPNPVHDIYRFEFMLCRYFCFVLCCLFLNEISHPCQSWLPIQSFFFCSACKGWAGKDQPLQAGLDQPVRVGHKAGRPLFHYTHFCRKPSSWLQVPAYVHARAHIGGVYSEHQWRWLLLDARTHRQALRSIRRTPMMRGCSSRSKLSQNQDRAGKRRRFPRSSDPFVQPFELFSFNRQTA